MKEYVGLSVIVMLMCFNVGMYIVDISGFYDISAPDSVDDTAGKIVDDSETSFLGIVRGYAGVATILSIAGISALIGTFTNIDPLRAAGIGAFLGTVLVTFTSSYSVINNFVQSVTGNSTFGIMVGGAVIGMFGFTVLIFIIQLFTGGWRNIK